MTVRNEAALTELTTRFALVEPVTMADLEAMRVAIKKLPWICGPDEPVVDVTAWPDGARGSTVRAVVRVEGRTFTRSYVIG